VLCHFIHGARQHFHVGVNELRLHLDAVQCKARAVLHVADLTLLLQDVTLQAFQRFRLFPHTSTATVLRPFFPGEPVPEENFWTLCCKGRLTEEVTLTIRLGATPSGLTGAHLHHHPILYRPDALPAAQPTVSKH